MLGILNTALLLRLPIHHAIRTWPRAKVLKIGAIIHMLAFLISVGATGDLDFASLLLLGIIPTSMLFMASYAVQRRALA
jgi:hypothetical protein